MGFKVLYYNNSCRRGCLFVVVVGLVFLVLMSNTFFFVPASLNGTCQQVGAAEFQWGAVDEVINWGVYKVKAPSVWSESTGAGVKIAVLDTGIGPIDDVKIWGGYNFVNNNLDTADKYGHGTLVASIIAAQFSSLTGIVGVAPDAQLYAVKVIDDQGGINLNHAISGVQWAIDNDMQIISMSWCINDVNNALKQVLDLAYSKGILMVAAAGNTGDIAYGVGCPAGYSSTIAVSAIKEDTSKYEQACTGSEIELSAPGVNVGAIGIDNKFRSITGTSFAVGYVTGTAALVWAKNTSLTNIQVRDILCKTATDLQPNDGLERDIFFGYGLVNAAAAVQAVSNNNSTNEQTVDPPDTNLGGSQSTKESSKQSTNTNAESSKSTQSQMEDQVNWAVKQINAVAAWTQSTGAGVKIAVLDTGIGPISDVKVYGGYNFVDNNQDTTDHNGHGTMIASIIAATHTNSLTGLKGVAPNAQIYAVKVIDDHGKINLEHAISGVQWAIDNNMQIISISWCVNDKNNALKQVLEAAYSKGILIIAAAGNVGEIQAGVGCPADYSSTIAVSAIKEDTRQLEQACSGIEIELTAPGGNIYAIAPDNKTHQGSGTSYAAAYVTGTAALIWAKNPSLTNVQVRNILGQTATDLQPNDGSKRDIYFGYGLINATAAIQATPNNPHTNITNSTNNNNTPKTTHLISSIIIVCCISTILVTTSVIILKKRARKQTHKQ
jgi:subtilisin family serine protease